ncbi:ribonucleoside-diphosphate reductase subunit alpha [Candidatus Poseidonia alphae]|nr:ribonucleoside-diphosphate reductase subunit alpha [Candidatus Poseidonia alphae]MDA8531008.1 ribonucleoside-diphosphate reductase subunit alpha [Candidatus Poseidonia alphae]MDA8638278.1 ribonucleoside-diphosphate reductase subunit alpha [Candidatus Poseidonia alphae]MDA8838984.1 ribonucleoside-diphosphate reductase subunit alpha [Candidatus Poseidonia alphae]MDB2335673.1 ribonucleoside-diphosphate reductase subunit alpha [Candidatus Poseidonia alphae]
MAMQVVNRKGEREDVRFDAILEKLTTLSEGLNSKWVDPGHVTKLTIEGLYDGVTTRELDQLAAETAASLASQHPEYSRLAARICVDDLHRATKDSFTDVITDLREYIDPESRKHAPLISEEVFDVIMEHADVLNNHIDYSRDNNYDYFGFKTLERSYLLRLNGEIAERPQHMLMRVSVGIHHNNIPRALETYDLMSQGYFTHATPTLFNSGTPMPQMSSCFLLTMQDDSLDGIYDTLKQCALISKSAGGIGLSIHHVRSKGSYIKGTNGTSNGIVPMLRVFNDTARYVDQGGGKRKGSIAVYLEPWHPDILQFLDLKKNHGKEELRARDLFYAMWTPDLFMERVEQNADWSFFCPNECPGLQDVYGDEFKTMFEDLERRGLARETVPARTIWDKIVESQIETGTPYMLYKDAANNKSNQKNLGTIRSSNLCTEIMEYTAKDEVAVCNLASIALPKFVNMSTGEFDHQKLFDVTYHATGNLNRVIDVNYYPVEEARNSNMRHRPIGLGVQGLADTFAMLEMNFDGAEARSLNKEIFETIYYAACTASKDAAIAEGPYSTFKGSPASKGVLQFDLWGMNEHSGRWDWSSLKEEIVEHGMRNSLLVAPMPTASTSQILGNNECFEAFTSNLYVRRTLSGEFVVLNRHLVRDLIKEDLWSIEMKNEILRHKGSIQAIANIPEKIRNLYKTTWEISQRHVLDMAADRGAYIDQSQSLNIHMVDANPAKVTSMHFYGWKQGLKTGMYYLRTKAAADAIQFTLESKSKDDQTVGGLAERAEDVDSLEAIACSLDTPDDCLMCGS